MGLHGPMALALRYIFIQATPVIEGSVAVKPVARRCRSSLTSPSHVVRVALDCTSRPRSSRAVVRRLRSLLKFRVLPLRGVARARPSPHQDCRGWIRERARVACIPTPTDPGYSLLGFRVSLQIGALHQSPQTGRACARNSSSRLGSCAGAQWLFAPRRNGADAGHGVAP